MARAIKPAGLGWAAWCVVVAVAALGTLQSAAAMKPVPALNGTQSSLVNATEAKRITIKPPRRLSRLEGVPKQNLTASALKRISHGHTVHRAIGTAEAEYADTSPPPPTLNNMTAGDGTSFNNYVQDSGFANGVGSYMTWGTPTSPSAGTVSIPDGSGIIQSPSMDCPGGTMFVLAATGSVNTGSATANVGFYDLFGNLLKGASVAIPVGAAKSVDTVVVAPMNCSTVWVWAGMATTGTLTLTKLGVGPVISGPLSVDFAAVAKCINSDTVGMDVQYWRNSAESRAQGQTLTGALLNMSMGSLRFPGGEKSDAYLWSMPPYTSQNPTLSRISTGDFPAGDSTIYTLANQSFVEHPMGFDDFMQLAKNVSATPAVCVNYDSANYGPIDGGTARNYTWLRQNAIAWVTYAKQKSYAVKFWELGNESYIIAYNGFATAAQYTMMLLDWVPAMKAANSAVKISANGPYVATQKGGLDATAIWWQQVLSNASGIIDYMTIHNYPAQDWASYNTYQYNVFNFQQSMQQAEYAIQTYAAPADRGTRIRIAITESGPEDWSGGTYQTGNDLGHQLVIFDSTASLLQWPRLDYLMFWNTRWYPNGGSIYDALDYNNDLQSMGLINKVMGQHLRSGCFLNATSTQSMRMWALKITSGTSTSLKIILLNKQLVQVTQVVNFLNFSGSTTGTMQTYTDPGGVQSYFPVYSAPQTVTRAACGSFMATVPGPGITIATFPS